MNKRKMLTFSLKIFDFFKPKPEDICIEDIAHHLALINRYNGAIRVPYSVAEHCVRASYLTTGDPLVNLLHDSAEAYIGDIIAPHKYGLGWDFLSPFGAISYGQVEAEILRQIGKALDVSELACWLTMPKETKAADITMYLTEVRDLMPPQGYKLFRELGWIPDGFEPLPDRIVPWAWQKAEREFLMRYKELTRCPKS